MIKRILVVFLALAALAAVVVGVRAVLSHNRRHPIIVQPQRTFPRKYVGVVSYNIAKFDKACGCTPNVAVHYIHIGGTTEMGVARSIVATGAIPMLEIEPFSLSLARIASGGEDPWLSKYAQAVRSLHSPVVMSFAPEANGTWYSWGYRHQSAGEFVSAWRHVVTLFRKSGVRDVTVSGPGL